MVRLVLALAALLTVLTALTASAAMLEVDGGVLQVFRFRAEIDLSPLRATVDIKPETLEKKSEGEPVIAFIELPERYDETEIDLSTVRLCLGTEPCDDGVSPGGVPPARVVGGRLRVGFDRAAVLALVGDVAPPAAVTFTVSGRLASGRPFSGSDTVNLVSPGGPPAPAGNSVQETPGDSPADPAPPNGGEPASAPEPEVTPEPTPTAEVTPPVEPTVDEDTTSASEQSAAEPDGESTPDTSQDTETETGPGEYQPDSSESSEPSEITTP